MSDERTFEQAQRELEEIVQRLESGEAPLDEALELWERGEELYRFCKEPLDTAEGQDRGAGEVAPRRDKP